MEWLVLISMTSLLIWLAIKSTPSAKELRERAEYWSDPNNLHGNEFACGEYPGFLEKKYGPRPPEMLE